MRSGARPGGTTVSARAVGAARDPPGGVREVPAGVWLEGCSTEIGALVPPGRYDLVLFKHLKLTKPKKEERVVVAPPMAIEIAAGDR